MHVLPYCTNERGNTVLDPFVAVPYSMVLYPYSTISDEACVFARAAFGVIKGHSHSIHLMLP